MVPALDDAGAPTSLVVVSGGTGRTCQQVVRAALAQFPGVRPQVVVHSGVDSVEAALRIAESAAVAGAVVCHSLVHPDVRERFITSVERRGVPCVDILGPLLGALEDALGVPPLGKPGLSQELHKEQFDRMDAVDFTLAHDDGQRVDGLHRADLVLVGVSRVSKSVTCFYLAYRGVRAANVPLGDQWPPPGELLSLPVHKVVGLTMNPHRLRLLREMRLPSLGSAAGDYAREASIQAELRAAERLMQAQGWRVIDVSYKAVEEVAHELLQLIVR